MLEILEAICLSTALLVVWFETDAFVVYLTTFGLGWQTFDLARYKDESEKDPMLDYPSYLLMNYPDSFFIKLLSCPLCIGVWISLFCVVVFGFSLAIAPVIYVFSLVLFFLLCKLYR